MTAPLQSSTAPIPAVIRSKWPPTTITPASGSCPLSVQITFGSLEPRTFCEVRLSPLQPACSKNFSSVARRSASLRLRLPRRSSITGCLIWSSSTRCARAGATAAASASRAASTLCFQDIFDLFRERADHVEELEEQIVIEARVGLGGRLRFGRGLLRGCEGAPHVPHRHQQQFQFVLIESERFRHMIPANIQNTPPPRAVRLMARAQRPSAPPS